MHHYPCFYNHPWRLMFLQDTIFKLTSCSSLIRESLILLSWRKYTLLRQCAAEHLLCGNGAVDTNGIVMLTFHAPTPGLGQTPTLLPRSQLGSPPDANAAAPCEPYAPLSAVSPREPVKSTPRPLLVQPREDQVSSACIHEPLESRWAFGGLFRGIHLGGLYLRWWRASRSLLRLSSTSARPHWPSGWSMKMARLVAWKKNTTQRFTATQA